MDKMTKKDNSIRDKIIKGLELTHKKLIQSKKDKKLVLVVSEKGKIVHLNPENLLKSLFCTSTNKWSESMRASVVCTCLCSANKSWRTLIS